jgi:hypothetical protein
VVRPLDRRHRAPATGEHTFHTFSNDGFVALQECVSLAAHWLADQGLDVPQTCAICSIDSGSEESSRPRSARVWRQRQDSAI